MPRTQLFIQKLKSYKIAHSNSYLVICTSVVSSLYINIPHEAGLDSYKVFLNIDIFNSLQLQIDSILSLIRRKLVLL